VLRCAEVRVAGGEGSKAQRRSAIAAVHTRSYPGSLTKPTFVPASTGLVGLVFPPTPRWRQTVSAILKDRRLSALARHRITMQPLRNPATSRP
jgi:hypothetical protein